MKVRVSSGATLCVVVLAPSRVTGAKALTNNLAEDFAFYAGHPKILIGTLRRDRLTEANLLNDE